MEEGDDRNFFYRTSDDIYAHTLSDSDSSMDEVIDMDNVDRYYCAVCDGYMSFECWDEHINSTGHSTNMVRAKPLKRFDLGIVRKVPSGFHCGVCNEVFIDNLCDNHCETPNHSSKLLFCINKAADYDTNSDDKNKKDKVDKMVLPQRNMDNGNANHDPTPMFNEYCHDEPPTIEPENETDNAWSNIVSYAKMAGKTKSKELPAFIKVDLQHTVVTAKYESWNMITYTSLNQFYCMACKVFDHKRVRGAHCDGKEHLDNLAKCAVVNVYETHLVRLVDDKWYHCGHCNNLQPRNEMDAHIEGYHPKIAEKNIVTNKEDKNETDKIKVDNKDSVDTNKTAQTQNVIPMLVMKECQKDKTEIDKPHPTLPKKKDEVNIGVNTQASGQSRKNMNEGHSVSTAVPRGSNTSDQTNIQQNYSLNLPKSFPIPPPTFTFNVPPPNYIPVSNIVDHLPENEKDKTKLSYPTSPDVSFNKNMQNNYLPQKNYDKVNYPTSPVQTNVFNFVHNKNLPHLSTVNNPIFSPSKQKPKTDYFSNKFIKNTQGNETSPYKDRKLMTPIKEENKENTSLTSNVNKTLFPDNKAISNPAGQNVNYFINKSIIITEQFGCKLYLSVESFNTICKKDNMLYCLVCDMILLMESTNHITEMDHVDLLQKMPFLPNFKHNLIRAVRNQLHCAICNIVLPNDRSSICGHITKYDHNFLLTKALFTQKAIPDLNLDIQEYISQDTQLAEPTINISENSLKNNHDKNINNNCCFENNNTNYDNVDLNKHITISTEFNESKVNKRFDLLDQQNNSTKEQISDNLSINKDVPKESLSSPVCEKNQSESDCNDYPYESEYVIIKLRNVYMKIYEDSWNTVVFRGDGTMYCFTCAERVYYDNINKHIDSMSHMVKLEELKVLNMYGNNLLRQINNIFHCAFCNVLIVKPQLEAHLKWPQHVAYAGEALIEDRKSRDDAINEGLREIEALTQTEFYNISHTYETKILHHVEIIHEKITDSDESENDEDNYPNDTDNTVKKLSRVVIIDDDVLKINFDNWHGIVDSKKGTKCVICNYTYESKKLESHLSCETHKMNVNKPFSTVHRKHMIRELSEKRLHCIVCNIELNQSEDITQHVNGKKHNKNLKMLNDSSAKCDNYDNCDDNVVTI